MKTNEQGFIITRDPDFLLRFATVDDAQLVYEYGGKLASYLGLADIYRATPEKAERLLADKKGEAVFGYYKGELVAFSFFTEKASIFIGENGIYVDMAFIDDSMRGKGLGTILFSFLCRLAEERGCRRLEWSCLDSNTAALGFYAKMGAVQATGGQHVYRFTPDIIIKHSEEF